MKILLFEEFSDKERQKLIDNKDTYISKNEIVNKNIFDMAIKNVIMSYDFNKFKIDIKTYEINICPDPNFINLIKKLNPLIENDICFSLSIDKERLNIIDLFFDLDKSIRGLNIGYKIYKLLIDKYNYITSDYGLKPEARNIWYKLMIDDDYYSFTSKICSGVIKKNLNDVEILKILNKIKDECLKIYGIDYSELIFDNKIKEKLYESDQK